MVPLHSRTYLHMYVPLYSTSQSGVEQILSSTTKMVPLHLCTYLRTNVHYTPLACVPTYECTLHSTPHHTVEWNEEEYEFIQKTRCWKNHKTLKKPDAENIAQHWKSQMLKKLPDSEKASNLLPVARVYLILANLLYYLPMYLQEVHTSWDYQQWHGGKSSISQNHPHPPTHYHQSCSS